MKPQDIKFECEEMYERIRISEGRLKYLRSICNHEHTFIGDYSYRAGSHIKSEICTYCLTQIRSLE